MGLLYGDFDEIMNNTYYYFWKIYVCLTVACNGALEYVFKHKPLNCNGKFIIILYFNIDFKRESMSLYVITSTTSIIIYDDCTYTNRILNEVDFVS